jgi:hypothetical protein
VVAAHFIAGGAANGFMPLGTYRRFTIALQSTSPALKAAQSGHFHVRHKEIRT